MSAAMHTHTSTTVIAAASAEQARQLLLQEEEELTHYSDQHLSEDWEFKIVRSATGAFRKPEEFAKLLEEEGRFGWVLLEKLDNGRVRFKRRAGSRPRAPLGSQEDDPYRSIYGTSPNRQAAMIGFVVMGVLVLMIGLMVLLVR
jgi:hypothetical protein